MHYRQGLLLIALVFLLAPPLAWAGPGIAAVQGNGLVSPLAGDHVHNVPGSVTSVTDHGFYLQDPAGDGDPSTSDAIFIYTHDKPAVHTGDKVQVSGRVREYQPGGEKTHNLTITEIQPSHVRPVAGNEARVKPTPIGHSGRAPPKTRIAGPVPGNNGIAFYESLEGMRVQAPHPQVVGPTNRFGEFWIVPDGGTHATGMNPSGGITLRRVNGTTDYNPERIRVVFAGSRSSTPDLDVGDQLATITGVITYSYGNYELVADAPPQLKHSPVERRSASLEGNANTLTVATYNVENLGPGKADNLNELARQISSALNGPDILAIQEVQDDSGPADDGVTSAAGNIAHLLRAIRQAGGPRYASVQINPLDGRDGGKPGSNIRPVILYNPQRVALVKGTQGRGGSTRPTKIVPESKKPTLTRSPGRIDPRADAFTHSRKPLAAIFAFRGQRLIVVDNHLTAKLGSTPLYGARQPPVDGGREKRRSQAGILRGFSTQLLRNWPKARLIVLGDLNDFGFSKPVQRLDDGPHAPLHDLLENLPATERYTYIYQGNSQALDHMLASPALQKIASVEIVHLNAGFANQVSDHDPIIAAFDFSG